LGARYSDSILRLSFIRAASKSELSRRKYEEENNRRELVKQRMLDDTDTHKDEYNLELAMAVFSGKLPHPELSGEIDKIENTKSFPLVKYILQQNG